MSARQDETFSSVLIIAAAALGVRAPRDPNNPKTPTDKRLTSLYPSARDEVLELRPWASALRRFEMPRAENITDTGPGALYHMPSDVSRFVSVGAADWQREGDVIRADYLHVAGETLSILYNSNHWDVRFSASLKALIAAALALKCAMAAQQSARLVTAREKAYDRALIAAHSHEGSESGAWEAIPPSLAELVNGAGGGFWDSGRNYAAAG